MSDDLLADLDRHQLAGRDEGYYGCCVACDFDWPCDAARAADAIRRIRQLCDDRWLSEVMAALELAS